MGIMATKIQRYEIAKKCSEDGRDTSHQSIVPADLCRHYSADKDSVETIKLQRYIEIFELESYRFQYVISALLIRRVFLPALIQMSH